MRTTRIVMEKTLYVVLREAGNLVEHPLFLSEHTTPCRLYLSSRLFCFVLLFALELESLRERWKTSKTRPTPTSSDQSLPMAGKRTSLHRQSLNRLPCLLAGIV